MSGCELSSKEWSCIREFPQYGGVSGYVVRMRPWGQPDSDEVYVAEFEIIEISGISGDGDGKTTYYGGLHLNCSDPESPVVEPVIRGSIKWDGCVDLSTGGDCMLHVCGRRDLQHIAKVLSQLHDVALEVLTVDDHELYS